MWTASLYYIRHVAVKTLHVTVNVGIYKMDLRLTVWETAVISADSLMQLHLITHFRVNISSQEQEFQMEFLDCTRTLTQYLSQWNRHFSSRLASDVDDCWIHFYHMCVTANIVIFRLHLDIERPRTDTVYTFIVYGVSVKLVVVTSCFIFQA